MFNGKCHYKLPFSIAMLNYQRVKLVLQNPEGETTVYHAVELLNFALLIEQKPLL